MNARKLLDELLDTAKKRRYTHFSDEVPGVLVSKNSDHVSWKLEDEDGKILNEGNGHICYASLMYFIRTEKDLFDKKLYVTLRPVDMAESWGNLIPKDDFFALAKLYRSCGIFPKRTKISKENRRVQFRVSPWRHNLYTSLCFYRHLVNDGMYAWAVYQLREQHYPELPYLQVFAYVTSIYGLGRSGHWYHSEAYTLRHRLDIAIVEAEFHSLPMNKREKHFGKVSWAGHTESFFSLHAQGLGHWDVLNQEIWLRPEITRMYTNPKKFTTPEGFKKLCKILDPLNKAPKKVKTNPLSELY